MVSVNCLCHMFPPVPSVAGRATKPSSLDLKSKVYVGSEPGDIMKGSKKFTLVLPEGMGFVAFARLGAYVTGRVSPQVIVLRI